MNRIVCALGFFLSYFGVHEGQQRVPTAFQNHLICDTPLIYFSPVAHQIRGHCRVAHGGARVVGEDMATQRERQWLQQPCNERVRVGEIVWHRRVRNSPLRSNVPTLFFVLQPTDVPGG